MANTAACTGGEREREREREREKGREEGEVDKKCIKHKKEKQDRYMYKYFKICIMYRRYMHNTYLLLHPLTSKNTIKSHMKVT